MILWSQWYKFTIINRRWSNLNFINQLFHLWDKIPYIHKGRHSLFWLLLSEVLVNGQRAEPPGQEKTAQLMASMKQSREESRQKGSGAGCYLQGHVPMTHPDTHKCVIYRLLSVFNPIKWTITLTFLFYLWWWGHNSPQWRNYWKWVIHGNF